VRIEAERSYLAKLEGGCQVPIAGHAVLENGRLHMVGMVSDLNAEKIIRDEISGKSEDAKKLGRELATRMLKAGASEILDVIYGRNNSCGIFSRVTDYLFVSLDISEFSLNLSRQINLYKETRWGT